MAIRIRDVQDICFSIIEPPELSKIVSFWLPRCKFAQSAPFVNDVAIYAAGRERDILVLRTKDRIELPDKNNYGI